MRRAIWILCASLTLAFDPAAVASPFSDFNAGISSRNSARCDLAIGFMTSALNAPDLLASLRPVALDVRGECNIRQGKLDAALADFDASLALRPDDFDTYMLRGGVHVRLKHYDRAEADFSQLIRIRPDLGRGYVVLGAVYALQQKYDAAIGEFTALVATASHEALGHLLRARVRLTKGDLDAALDDANRLVELFPQQPQGYITRATVYIAQAKFSRAMTDIDDALEHLPGNPSLIRQKGVVQWEMGHFADAAETLSPLAKSDAASGYSVIWIDLVRTAGGIADDDLQARAQAVDPVKWPAAIVQLYLGKSTPDAVDGAVGGADAEERNQQQCEADFYVAEWQLHHQAKEPAVVRLQRAAASCPIDFVERAAAVAELKRLP